MGVDDNMIWNFDKKSIRPDIEMGIVSISPVCGCSGGCGYCYLCLRDISGVEINGFGLEETVEWLNNHPEFSAGANGNILCMGSWGEIFPQSKAIRDIALIWIETLLELGNPMAVFTKGYLSAEEVTYLNDIQKYPHQLMVLGTVTSIGQAKKIEPGCIHPRQRFQTLENCKKQGLDAVLYINPYLKGITDIEVRDLFEACKNSNVDDVVISPLFYDDKILKEMAGRESMNHICERLKSEEGNRSRGMSTVAGPVAADEITEDHSIIEGFAEKYRLNIYNHYMCVLSRQYGRKNTPFWKNPVVCRDCGHCAEILDFDG